MKNRPYFVIFGAMRTGSNLLEKTIEGLGDTVCYGEAYNPAFIGDPKTQDLFAWDKSDRDTDPLGFMTLLRGEAGGRIPGFRYFEGHAPDLAPVLLSDPDCRRIVLQRDPLASYLSLKAARETGQWMLRNAHRRVEVMVCFDEQEFEAYREQLVVHYAWLKTEMDAAGAEALWLNYDDLQDPGQLRRVVQHIGSSGEIPQQQPILRQNPQPLPERVSNYAQMCDWLGMHPEPRKPPPLPEPKDILACRNGPLAVAPLDGPGGEASVSLLYRLELRSFGGPALSYAQLQDPKARQAVFLSGLQGEVLQSVLDTRQLLSVVCHPATRLHSFFLTELFGRDWHVSLVRRRLMALHGGIPSPKELERKEKAVEPARHLALFSSFLDLLAEAQCGQGVLPPRLAWLPQADLLRQYQALAGIDRIGLLEDLPSFASQVAEMAGASPLPEKHLAAIVERAVRDDLPIKEVMTPEVGFKLQAVHGIDFKQFGYGLWPDGQ